jgi:hypothetical protein
MPRFQFKSAERLLILITNLNINILIYLLIRKEKIIFKLRPIFKLKILSLTFNLIEALIINFLSYNYNYY